MTESSISFDLQDCIKTLNFISDIPENHKPCYNSMTSIAKDAWFTTVRRRWGGEKGENGIIHVTNILDSCDHHYRMCLQSTLKRGNTNRTEGIETLKRLRDTLVKAGQGFDNLINTYSDQPEVSNDYKNLRYRVNIMVKDINHDIKQLSIVRNISSNIVEDNTVLNYISPGWGYLSDEYDSTSSDSGDFEKKNIEITSLDQGGSSKKGFFKGDNIILMRTKPIKSGKK